MADACLRTERHGDHKNDTLTASMFSGDLMGRASPLLLFCTEPVSPNVMTHNRTDFQSGTGPNGAMLKRFQKARWVETTEPPLEK
jgi:hypothetical protein